MESIGDARAFLSAAREVALTKPIIVIKAGRTDAGRQGRRLAHRLADRQRRGAGRRLPPRAASCASTASPTSSTWPRCSPSSRARSGPRLTIVTNAGGPGVLATDALITGGGELAELSPRDDGGAQRRPAAAWSHNNPVDILGDAGPERYAKALEIAAKDPNSDGLLVILTPQAMTDPTQTAEQLKPLRQARRQAGPRELDGRRDVAAGEAILNRAGIPTFPYPDTAARVFNYMWRYSYNLRGLYETPALPDDAARWTPDRELAEAIIAAVARERPHDPDRARVEAAAGRLRHPDRRDARRRPTTKPRSRPRTDRLSRSCSSSTPRRSRTRPTSAACS